MIAGVFLWLVEANRGKKNKKKTPLLMKSINPATARQLRCGRPVRARHRGCAGCLWVVIETNLICSCFRHGLHFSLMSALPASQGWAQQGQRLALTRIKPMKKFEFIGPYLAATCGVLWANGRIGSLFFSPPAKNVFLANRHLSNMTIGSRENSWRGPKTICLRRETTCIACLREGTASARHLRQMQYNFHTLIRSLGA